MPSMIDLKSVKEEDKSVPEMESNYPYGLSLYLCDDVVTALKAGGLKPGDKVSVTAMAVVTMTNERSDLEDTDKSINIQLTEMGLTKKGSDRVKEMYGQSGGEGDGE